MHGHKLLKNKDESGEWRDLAPSARTKSSVQTKINGLFTSTIATSSASIIYIINKLQVYFVRVLTEYTFWIIRVSQLSAHLSFPTITPDNREYTVHGSSSQINVTDINLAVIDLCSGYQIFLACKSSHNSAFLEIWKLTLWVPPMKKRSGNTALKHSPVFVVFSPGHGRSVTDFWGWDAREARLRCPDDVSGDIGGCSARRALKPKFY